MLASLGSMSTMSTRSTMSTGSTMSAMSINNVNKVNKVRHYCGCKQVAPLILVADLRTRYFVELMSCLYEEYDLSKVPSSVGNIF